MRRRAARRPLKSALLLLVAGAGLGSAGLAQAHGRPLAMMGFSVHPGDPATLLAGTTFGAVLSRDGGATWRWICEEAIGYEGDRFESRVQATPGGTLVAVGAGSGLRLSVDGGCSWQDALGPEGQGVIDLAMGTGPGARLWVTTSRYEGDNAVWVSSNDGLRFERTPLVRERLFLSSIRRLPGAGDRLRVAGWWFDPPQSWLFSSDDGGATWRERRLPIDEPVYLSAESPGGDRLWLRTNSPERNRVFRLDPEGERAEAVLEVPGVIRGVVESPAGTVWVAAGDGVHLSRDQGSTFRKLQHPSRYPCLAAAGGPMIACGSLALDGWNAGVTSDSGGSWRPLLRFPDISGAMVCPRQSPGSQCASYWPDLAAKLGEDPAIADGGPSAPVADAGVDGGAVEGRPVRVSGGCELAPGGVTGGGLLWGLATVIALGRRRPRQK